MTFQPKLLLIEDSLDESGLVLQHLKQADVVPHFRRVESLINIETALQEEEWDAVICDFNFPKFSALDAISVVKKLFPHIPCIVLSGSIGEELVAETLKAGADDYVLKDNMIRFIPILKKVLKEAQLNKERKLVDSALKTTEENLRQAQKLESIGQLAGGIAHDFNNVLATILIQSEVLKEGLDPTLSSKELVEYANKAVEQIIKSAGRATNLTRQLLAFSRKQVLQTKVINLNLLIADMQNMLRRIVEENIEFTTVLASDLKNIQIDPGHLEQIVMNLVVNSRDAMASGGKLEITTQNSFIDETIAKSCNVIPGPHVLLTVSDDGMGMSSEVQKHLFEPFFTTKPIGKGTGLGLCTVYGIVKQNRGLIFVESTVNKGTIFKLYFPICEDGIETIKITEKNVATLKGTETILVVEDEEDLRDLICKMLGSNGYNVLSAATGIDALEKIKSGVNIDLILTDVIMPQMGGPELAKQTEKLRKNIKFLFQTGYSKATLLENGLDDSQIHFLAKPYPFKTLLHKLRTILD